MTLSYIVPYLGQPVGALMLGVFNLSCLICLLVIAPPIAASWNPRQTIMLGGFLFAASTWIFVITLISLDPTLPKDEVSAITYGFGMMFAIIGGMAAGFIWAPWGTYMASATEAIMQNGGCTQEEVTSDLTTIFGIVYVLLEMACSIISSPLQQAGLTDVGLFILYAIIASVTALLYPLTQDHPTISSKKTVGQKLIITLSLWGDLRLWLFGTFTAAFAVSAAYLGAVLNAKVTESPLFFNADKNIRSPYLGYFDSLVTAVAALAAYLGGVLVKKSRHGQFLGILSGALGFILVALFSIVVALSGMDLADVGYALVLPYVFQGVGRGVYESVNKAMFLDNFPNQHESAFANQMIFFLIPNGIFYMIIRPYRTNVKADAIPDEVRNYALLVISLLAVPNYVIAKLLSRKALKETDESQ